MNNRLILRRFVFIANIKTQYIEATKSQELDENGQNTEKNDTKNIT